MKNCVLLVLSIFLSFQIYSQDLITKAIDHTVDSIKKMNLPVEKTFTIPSKPDSSEFMNVFYFGDGNGAVYKIKQELKENGKYEVNHYYFSNNELIKIESASSKENLVDQHVSYY